MENRGEPGFKIRNSVIVSGPTGRAVVNGVTETEHDIVYDFLEEHGPIKRVTMEDDDSSEFYLNLIVEFESGQALESLQPLLPQKIAEADNPSVIFEIKALSNVYNARSDRVLADLQGLDFLSGADPEQNIEMFKKCISQLEAVKPRATETDTAYVERIRTQVLNLQLPFPPVKPKATEADAVHVETEALTLQPDTHKDPECHSQKSDTDTKANTCKSCSNLIEDLRKQVASLQSQLTLYEKQGKINDKSQQGRSKGGEATRAYTEPDMPGRTRKEPRPWYCFSCGANRHIARSCSNPENPALVAKKREQLRMQQREWLAQKNRPKSGRHVTNTDLDAREKVLSLVRAFTGKSPDLTKNTVHTTPPGVRSVETPIDAQNVNKTPEVANPPDKTDSTSEFTGPDMTDSALELDTAPDSGSTSDSSSVLSEQDSDQSDLDVKCDLDVEYKIIQVGSFYNRVRVKR